MPDQPEGKIPLYYTFGNHMHWVDMEWLWGYATLSSSVADMLFFISQSGAKGQINFDGIGYEKLAVQDPETLSRLRSAIQAGTVEVAGASYGQPYGLFHGGESNIRQRIYGARTVRRLLGVWPRTFWEEEFDFFPQLPQILCATGFEYASLYFQWTWHTPHLPLEKLPAIWWEGLDGSRLLAIPRSDLNLHQWPEEFSTLLANPELRQRSLPCLVQWLELMPSPDWMCRAELILPPLKALLAHPDFAVQPVNLPEFLDLARPLAEPRRYTLDDVFHGMSLGKNGDLFRRLSRRAEQSVLAAESVSALYAVFGRPYPSWDVYPTWELEEAWRELLSAQHHDNEECEGLCGYIGERSFERSVGLSQYVSERTLNLLARRTAGSPNRLLIYNPLGWQRRAVITDPASGKKLVLDSIPSFGYKVVEPDDYFATPSGITVGEDADCLTLERNGLVVRVDRMRGAICQIYSPDFPHGILPPGSYLADISMVRHEQLERFTGVRATIEGLPSHPAILVERTGRDGARLNIRISLAPELEAVDIIYQAHGLPRPDPRLSAALQTTLSVNLPELHILHDHPYGVSEIHAQGSYLRKYPTGDWMTSPQVFETIENPFTALQFLDLCETGRQNTGGRGLLVLHDGSQAYLRRGGEIRQVLSMYDPWDEDYFVDNLDARVRIIPHGELTHTERWRLAQEFTRQVWVVSCASQIRYLPPICAEEGGELPVSFAAAACASAGVVMSALYREMEESGREVAGYAGRGMAYPYILRLVELNGEPGSARLTFPGYVATAYRTDLLGRIQEELKVQYNKNIDTTASISEVNLELRPHEIATVYLDLDLGRKVFRDLDAERKVWATVHRVEA